MQAGRVRVSILKLLKERDMHGYQIMSEIRDRSSGLLSASAGTVYPILLELEKHGHVSSKWEESRGRRKRKIYHLTSKGSRTVRAIEKLREGMAKRVNEGLVETARVLEINYNEIPEIRGGRGFGAWFPMLKFEGQVKSKGDRISMLKKMKAQVHERITFLKEREKALSRAIASSS